MPLLDRLKSVDVVEGTTENVIKEKIKSAVHDGKYHEAIHMLDELQDCQNGIHHHEIKGSDADRDILLRDATAAKDDASIDQKIICLQQILCLLRAAELLDHQNTLDNEYLKFLASIAHRSLLQPNNFNLTPPQILAEITTYLVGHMALKHNISHKETKKRLNYARHFVNLEKPTRIVATRMIINASDNKEHTVYEVDEPILLAETQKAQYKKVNDRKRPAYLDNLPSWYKNMGAWQKHLVNQVSDSLQRNQQVIPIGLQNELPGPKETYRQYLIENGEDGIHITGTKTLSGTQKFDWTMGQLQHELFAGHVTKTCVAEAAKRIAKAGHAQFMAAAEGGTIGAIGAKLFFTSRFTSFRFLRRYFNSPLLNKANKVVTVKPGYRMNSAIKHFNEQWNNASGNLVRQKELIDIMLGFRVARTQMKAKRFYHSEAKALEKSELLEYARHQLKAVEDEDQLAELIYQLQIKHDQACGSAGMKQGSTGKLLKALSNTLKGTQQADVQLNADDVVDAGDSSDADAAPVRAAKKFFEHAPHHMMTLERECFTKTWDETLRVYAVDGYKNGDDGHVVIDTNLSQHQRAALAEMKLALTRILALAKEQTLRKGSCWWHLEATSERKAHLLQVAISDINATDDKAILTRIALIRRIQKLQLDHTSKFQANDGSSGHLGETAKVLKFIVDKIDNLPKSVQHQSGNDEYNPENDPGYYQCS